jgi:mannose/cellobiose epimerase-like protein (N-acyl-D-glucosamine 2-epimerase family)
MDRMAELNFTFFDLIAGYVTSSDADQKTFGLRTSDGREFRVKMAPTCYAELVRNLNEPYQDVTGRMNSLLTPGQYLFAHGMFYPEQQGLDFEANHMAFVGVKPDDYRFERSNWWIEQVRALGDFYLRAQFEGGEVDYRQYRTKLSLAGIKTPKENRQETDTISRLVYGFASAFLMTGEDRFLDAAEKGVQYLRDHMRFYDADEELVYWYHGIDIRGAREDKVFASEFGDDYDAIPAYEQIYAMAGPMQTYRITGDPDILRDAQLTVKLFDEFLLDRERGGYFSHLDPFTLDPRSEALGHNRARKNWNSVGDHAPAYLVNLWLATGDAKYARMLEYTFDTIAKHFPDYEHSPFVNERFHEDWSHDLTWGWQQNRAVVGHNLKIAWNLMRMHSLKPKEEYVALAKKIAAIMPGVGSDLQRGGWYDVMERVLEPGQKYHRFVWHDRKAWWQQEQSILAYLILNGLLQDPEYQRHAREAAAFYNGFFLDHDEGGIYFNVLANGVPYLLGTERYKGSHSMSGYHSFELCYLATTYTNLLVTGQPMDLYFKPKPGGFKNNLLRVSPDILPPGRVRIDQVWADGEPYHDFEAGALTVRLPSTKDAITFKVRLAPTSPPST